MAGDQLQLERSLEKLMSKELLDSQLENLEIGGMREGPGIYKLWKFLLKMWISDGNEVYILSPFLDDKRLKDIADICYDYKYSFPNSITIYTRKDCDNGRQISDLKKAISKDYDCEKELFVKNEVFDNIITSSKHFHGKFIASIKDDISDVLLTSANFNSSHFEYNIDTVIHKRMTKDQFLENYINPIK